MAIPKLMFERRPARKEGEIGLFPTEQWAEERMYSYPLNAPLGLTITNFKRIGKMGWYWGGLGLLVENIDDDRFSTTRRMHDAILTALGMTTKLYRIDGSWWDVPDSIAVDNMDDAEFEKFFERARQLMVDLWGADPWQMWKDERPKQLR